MVSSSKFWVQTQIELSMNRMCCLSLRMILSVQEDLDQPVIGNIHSIKSGAASSKTRQIPPKNSTSDLLAGSRGKAPRRDYGCETFSLR
jgi:hypothetical protein